jgi:SulP family sulfate permease
MLHGSYGTPIQIISSFRSLSLINIPTLLVSLFVILVITLSGKVSKKIPSTLLVMISAIAASWALDLSSYGITILGTLLAGLPHISLPDVPLHDIPKIFTLSMDCFIVILAQSAITSRAYAMKYSDTYNENITLIGLSFANIAAGISGTFVVNGSPTATEIIKNAGGKTQLTQLTVVFAVLITLMFLTKPFAYLPTCVLLSVVFLIDLQLVDIKGMTALHRQRPVEFFVALITAMTCDIYWSQTGH